MRRVACDKLTGGGEYDRLRMRRRPALPTRLGRLGTAFPRDCELRGYAGKGTEPLA